MKTWGTGSPYGHSYLPTTPPYPGISGHEPGAERCQHERTQGRDVARRQQVWSGQRGSSAAGGGRSQRQVVHLDRRQVTTGHADYLPQLRHQKPPEKNKKTCNDT